MAQKTYAGITVDINEDGHFTTPSQWTKEIAVEIAKEEGIILTDSHLAIIDYLRERHINGDLLSIRSINRSGIIDVKTFYELFPGSPLRKATKIGGIPKPASCV